MTKTGHSFYTRIERRISKEDTQIECVQYQKPLTTTNFRLRYASNKYMNSVVR